MALQTDYVAGFVDGEGCIQANIARNPMKPLGYQMVPRVRISHGWLAGFFDSEGCITTHISVFKGRPIEVYPLTRIELRDSMGILAGIASYLRTNGITSHCYEYDKTSRILVIYGIDAVDRFLGLILPYLWVKKREAKIMLEEILPRMRTGAHLTKDGFLQIMTYVDEMSRGRTKGKPRKYTKAYFEALWSEKPQSTEM